MKSFVLITLFLLFIFVEGACQIRLGTLVLQHHEVYELLGTDILVVDTLILHDSSVIRLNTGKRENYIHAKKIVVGKGSRIIGKGKNGVAGKSGAAATTPGGPCRNGTTGFSGTPGTSGQDGVSLFLYFDELKIAETLRIDLAGGDGGDGGKGGAGSDGNPGTRLCPGGNGGDGGIGEAGGNGGSAGALSFNSKYGTDLRSWMGEKILVRSYGGFAGLGGEGGQGGQRGLSTFRDGNQGNHGANGPDGTPGRPGAIFFERK